MQLDEVDVVGPEPEGLPGRLGRLGQPVVVVEQPFPDRATEPMIRGAEAGARTAGPPSTTAAAPSVNELHMRRVRTPATWGEARTSSTVTVRWNWASGLRDGVVERLGGGGGDLAHRGARPRP